MAIARYISGDAPQVKAKSCKQIREARDAGLIKSGGNRLARKRHSRRMRAEAEFNMNRRVAGLKGYFEPRAASPCKMYTQEEINTLNKGTKQNKNTITNIYDVFSESEIKQMLRECLKRNVWLGTGLKEHKIELMSDDHLINALCCLRKKERGVNGVTLTEKRYIRRFAQEISDRGILKLEDQ